MNLIQALNTYLWVWLETLKSLRRPAVLVPFLTFGLVESALLWSSSLFYRAPWGFLWVPLLNIFPGPEALHYPGYYLAVPDLTTRLDLVLGVFLGGLMTGWGVLILRDVYTGHPHTTGASMGSAARRYWALAAVAAASAVATYLIWWANAMLPPDWFEGYARRQLVRLWTYRLANVFVQGLLIYIPAWILISGDSLREAVRQGAHLFWKHRTMTIAIVLLPFVASVPVGGLLENPVVVATRFRPEVLLALAVLNLMFAGLCNWLVTGAAVRFFLYRTRLDRAPSAAAPKTGSPS